MEKQIQYMFMAIFASDMAKNVITIYAHIDS